MLHTLAAAYQAPLSPHVLFLPSLPSPQPIVGTVGTPGFVAPELWNDKPHTVSGQLGLLAPKNLLLSCTPCFHAGTSARSRPLVTWRMYHVCANDRSMLQVLPQCAVVLNVLPDAIPLPTRSTRATSTRWGWCCSSCSLVRGSAKRVGKEQGSKEARGCESETQLRNTLALTLVAVVCRRPQAAQRRRHPHDDLLQQVHQRRAGAQGRAVRQGMRQGMEQCEGKLPAQDDGTQRSRMHRMSLTVRACYRACAVLCFAQGLCKSTRPWHEP